MAQASRLFRLARPRRLDATPTSPQYLGLPRRGFATPVNIHSSFDPALGRSQHPPPPPSQPTPPVVEWTPEGFPRKVTSPKAAAQQGQRSSLSDSDPIGAVQRGEPIPRDPFAPPPAESFGIVRAPPGLLAAQKADRESPHAVLDTDVGEEPGTVPGDGVPGRGRDGLDERLLLGARKLLERQGVRYMDDGQVTEHAPLPDARAATTSLETLLQQFEDRAGRQLDFELAYESTPSAERKVPFFPPSEGEGSGAGERRTWEDGVVLVAFVTNPNGASGDERLSVCSGFAIRAGKMRSGAGEKTEDGIGEGDTMIVTCAHTLRASASPRASSSSSPPPPSLALVMTRSRQFFPIQTVLSSLPSSDLALLKIGRGLRPADAEASELRTLPISPYPAPVGSELHVSSFDGWEGERIGRGTRTRDGVDQQERREGSDRDQDGRWGKARLVEYKDPIGREARTGTYDNLHHLEFKLIQPERPLGKEIGQRQLVRQSFPPPGSSGGPIVDLESGSVVGVVKGTKRTLLDGERGEATPAEKVFEMFRLPNMP